MKATPYDLLARAHELIAQGWCQGALGRDARGRPAERLAVRFCAVGAVVQGARECGLAWAPEQDVAIRAVERQVGAGPLSTWNDRPERTQAEVLAVFARAAEAARQEGEK